MKQSAFLFHGKTTMLKKLTPILMCLAAVTSVQAQDYAKPIATINGEAIQGSDFVRRMIFLPGVGRLEGAKYIETYPGYLAMQQIINERLLLQLAVVKKVMPKPIDISAELDKRLAATPDLLKNLQMVGVTRADLEQSVKVEMAEFNLITMGINITDQEVEAHYKGNPSLFTIPKRYKLRGITVGEGAKADVDKALAGGMKFDEAAKKFSIDQAASKGGDIGEIAEPSLAPPTKAALSTTRIGQASAWITGSTGSFYKFYVEDIFAAKLLPLDVTLKAQVRRNLMLDRGRVRNNMDMMMLEMRNKAKLTCDIPGVSEMVDAWLKSKLPAGV